MLVELGKRQKYVPHVQTACKTEFYDHKAEWKKNQN